MQEVFYKLDNWSIIKLLGGAAVIFTGAIGLFSKIFLSKVTQTIQHNYNKRIEDVKGNIVKENNIIDSITKNHLSASQKFLDKKIQAYEMLWSSMLNLKNNFPAGISLYYKFQSDSQITDIDAFKILYNNHVMNPILLSYDRDEEMKKIADSFIELEKLKPYLSDEFYKLYHTFRAFIGSVTHQFIVDYQKSKIYFWKKDNHLRDFLSATLTKKELTYIDGIELNSFGTLVDLLEYKILQLYRSDLNIPENATDTIKYVQDNQKILIEGFSLINQKVGK